MHDYLMIRKVKADFDAIASIGTNIPGGLQEGFTTSIFQPFARCEISIEKDGYKSDQTRYVIYGVLVEVFADNPSEAQKLAISLALQSLVTASVSGTVGGGTGEPTGTVSYAWQKPPPGRSLMTAEERRGNKSVVSFKVALSIRVQW